MSKKEQTKARIFSDEVFLPLVEKTFIDADLNSNGVIEKSELAILLKQIHNSLGLLPPTEEDINSEFARLDIDKNGFITKEEFKTLVRDLINIQLDDIED